MIQRNLLRVSRSLNANLPNRTISTPLRRSSPSIRYPAISSSSGRITSRWYSDTTEAKKDEAKEPEKKAEAAHSTSAAEVEKLKKDLEAKTKEAVELKDQYLRALADYRNVQERSKRDAQNAKAFALQSISKDLIPSIDTLSYALTSIPPQKLSSPPAITSETPPETVLQTLHKDLVNLHQGLTMTETVLMDTLKKHGLVRTDPSVEGEKFDPNRHEAVFMAPQPEKEDGVVFHTQQKGYELNGRVLRAAQVGVVKNS
ncbi:putative mitochondrial co-chaperone GrpE [Tothia fuscella]|uniref:GrpE protein homolog n=1 Tax=Tothia fuscella TaxID=1048955 RepID=A0A9P4NZ26_9PEZI|nr:putative mitochondrial co-chaperone GrpE [Tothia fuscella]